MAEAHPVGFQWVMEAKKRGAKIIHVDPRFSRTSAVANLHVPIRAGADIAFVGGLINYVLQNEKYFDEYVRAYTNAPVIITEDFADTEDLDGLFSGFDAENRVYDAETWAYQGGEVAPASGARGMEPGRKRQVRQAARGEAHGSGGAAAHPDPDRDDTLQHPRCVFQILKRHFARYTPEVVAEVAGVPEEQFLQVARLITENSGRDRTTAFVYSLGWTQHTVGVQYIRTAAILQALLGNMGRPGGGILALRGHASIQGSTDIPTLFDLLPGYLPMPFAHGDDDLDSYVQDESVQNGFWANTRDYMVSLLKAWWGDAATADNDFCYDYLPRLTGSHSTYETVLAQMAGTCKGYFLFGQNPAVGSANARMQRMGLANLDWLVVRDLVMIESATFWQNGPEIETGEMRTEDIKTEVFFMPAAAHTEKSGSFTNTQRMLQWHHTAVEPAGDARSDLWFAYHLGRRIREKLAAAAQPAGRGRRDHPGRGRGPGDGPADPGPHLGLPDRGDRRTSRTPTRSWPRSTAGTPTASRSRRTPSSNPTARPRRLLDLLRCPGRRGEPGRPPQARPGAELGRQRVGLGLARQPPGALQPGVGRPGRQAVERAQGPGLVGRGERQVDRARHTRTSSPTGRRPTGRRKAPPGWRRSPASTRSSCRPTARPGCSPRPAWWTARCPRTTSRRNRRCPTCSTASSTTRSARSSRTRRTGSSPAAPSPGPRSSRT